MLDTALAARVSPETLRKIETGRVATPAFPTIAAIADVLGLSLDAVWAEISGAERVVGPAGFHPPLPGTAGVLSDAAAAPAGRGGRRGGADSGPASQRHPGGLLTAFYGGRAPSHRPIGVQGSVCGFVSGPQAGTIGGFGPTSTDASIAVCHPCPSFYRHILRALQRDGCAVCGTPLSRVLTDGSG